MKARQLVKKASKVLAGIDGVDQLFARKHIRAFLVENGVGTVHDFCKRYQDRADELSEFLDTLKILVMSRRPGKVVKCADGAIGRTYNDEMPHEGKICVHILALNAEQLRSAGPDKKTPERRLCDPATLKIIGFAD